MADVIAAWAGVITALTLLITAVGVLIPILRRTERAVGEVHKIVNQQRTDAQIYQMDLVNALHAAGIAVPVDQSLAPPIEEH